ncbi:hypothetical protein EVAR_27776_1 [Eumeta japonica]|uniref:Uncharacterized protein n=1 Tax=Eumeta variegata TaxID=151549 RepID=A0A4C1VE00_EUMVA|nr:hypothetical protein EVAR_27776_1 [Eumeta japonica]
MWRERAPSPAGPATPFAARLSCLCPPNGAYLVIGRARRPGAPVGKAAARRRRRPAPPRAPRPSPETSATTNRSMTIRANEQLTKHRRKRTKQTFRGGHNPRAGRHAPAAVFRNVTSQRLPTEPRRGCELLNAALSVKLKGQRAGRVFGRTGNLWGRKFVEWRPQTERRGVVQPLSDELTTGGNHGPPFVTDNQKPYTVEFI